MKHTLPLLLLFLCRQLPAQNQTSVEWLPQLSFDYRFNERLSANVNTFLEIQSLEKREGEKAQTGFNPQTFNLQAGLAYQWTTILNLSIGYQFGWRDLDEEKKDLEHRSLQQLSGAYSFGKYRLRARFRTEQRYFKQDNYQAAHRWRLRPSLDFPLQGERLHPGETYLNTQWEFLSNVFEDDALRLAEQRAYSGIGWLLFNGYRIETGLEYRSRRNTAGNGFRRRVFWRVNFTFR